MFYLSLWGLLPSTLENFLLEFLIKLLDIYLVDVRIKFKEIIKLDSASIRSNIDVLSLSPELKEKIVDLLCVWKNKEINCYNLAKDIFKLPQQLATESSSVSVLLLDEFPAILDYEDGASIVGCIRTLNEKQDSVVYLIAGSERKTMKQVVLDSMSPFYKQLIPKEIQPLSRENMEKFIKKNLSDLSIKDSAIDVIYKYTNGLPYYLNLIGIIIENRRSELKEKINLDGAAVEKLILNFLNQEGSLYYGEEFENLTDIERYILRSMVLHDVTSPRDIEKITKRKSTYIAAYLHRLKKKGIVFQDSIRSDYKVRDPMFEQWIKYEFKDFK